MLQSKLFKHFFSFEFIHYLLVVLAGGGLDFILFLFLYYQFGVHYWLAAGYAFFVASALGFLALKHWVFPPANGSLKSQYLKHGAAALNTLFMMEVILWIGIDFAHLPAWGVKLLAYGLTTSLNFTLSKFVTFR